MNITMNKEKSSKIFTSVYFIVLVALIALLIISLLTAVTIGSTSIPIEDVYGVIMHKIFGIGEVEKFAEGTALHDIVWHIRLPRLVLALAVGTGLAVCGVIMQAIVKNPLADPYVLGISSGSYLGAVVALSTGVTTVFGGNSVGVFAFIGAFVVSMLVIILSNIGGKSNSVKLILSGTAIGSICGAFSNFMILLLNDASTSAVVQWSMGGLGGADWESNGVILTVMVVGTLFFITQSRVLNLMLLGDESAITLGINVNRLRLLYLVISSLMIGFAVYKAGMIGFIGLVIPHIIRMIFGTNHSKLLPLSALLGGIFLIWADVLCRVILKGNEIPVGIITSLIGAPVFIYLMIRKKYGFGGGS